MAIKNTFAWLMAKGKLINRSTTENQLDKLEPRLDLSKIKAETVKESQIKVVAAKESKAPTLPPQTIRQYAKISEIPLKQILDVLKNSDYSCNADDVLNQNMRKKLSSFFRSEEYKEIRTKALALAEKKKQQALAEGEAAKAKAKALAETKAKALAEAETKAKALAETKAKALAEAETKALAYAEIKALAYAEIKATEALDDLRKIGQLIDLCFELLPEAQRVSIMQEMNNKLMSEVYVQPFYNYLKMRFHAKINIEYNIIDYMCSKEPGLSICEILLRDSLLGIEVDSIKLNKHNKALRYALSVVSIERIKLAHNNSKFEKLNNEYEKIEPFTCIVKIPQWIIGDYCDVKAIKELKKHKSYTAALIKTISFLIKFYKFDDSFDIKYWMKERTIVDGRLLDFEDFSFIGELFVDMGAIDSALRLYDVDEGVFNNSNALGLLTSSAINIGRLENAIKLISKLIEKEPYHPSIPIMQAEIKRLEQRDRLKSTFSIDFSKIDELSGVEFENLLMDKFSLLGFKVESTPKTGDFGADLIVENTEGTRIIIQCKRFKSKVNLKAVQEVIGAMGHYVGDMGIVITNNSFLNSAVKLAESHDIELWDGDKLVSFLANDLSFSEIMGK